MPDDASNSSIPAEKIGITEGVHMKVLLSWSGDNSHTCAQAMHEWLPLVLQSIEPWMSSADILPGSRWASELNAQLDTIDFGIIFLTKTNLTAPWILFEAGAVSKSLSTGRIIPYLIDLKPGELLGPLNQFQALTADQDGTHKLVKAIYAAAKVNKRTTAEIEIDKVFEMWWPSLQSKLTLSTAKSNIHENNKGGASTSDDEDLVAAAKSGKKDKGPDKSGDKMVDPLGLTLAKISPAMRERFKLDDEARGVVVTEVADDGVAFEKGIYPGDLIVEVSQDKVASPDRVIAKIDAARKDGDNGDKRVLFLIEGQAGLRFVALSIDKDK